MPPKKLKRTVPLASHSTDPTTNLSSKINLNYFLLLRAVTEVSKETLYKVFLHGTPNKTPMENLGDYLRIKKNLSMKAYKAIFDTNMRNEIGKDPSGKHFDVTLLAKTIMYACDGVAASNDRIWHDETLNKPDPTLEYLVTQVKNFRNDLLDTPEALDVIKLHNKIQEMRNILKLLINKACDRYSVDTISRDNYTQEIDGQLDNIKKESLDMVDVVEIVKNMTPQELNELVYKVPGLKDVPVTDVVEIVKNMTPQEQKELVYKVPGLKYVPVTDVVEIVKNITPQEQKELVYRVPALLKDLPVTDVVEIVKNMTPQEQKELVYRVPGLLKDLSVTDVVKIIKNMTPQEQKGLVYRVPGLLKDLSVTDVVEIVKNMTQDGRMTLMKEVLMDKNVLQMVLDELKPNFEVLKQNFLEEVQKDRREMFGGKASETVSPVSFLYNQLDLELDVDQVYTELRTLREYHSLSTEEIDSSHLFTHVVNRTSGKPALVMVVGLAGSGKTTMLKMITQEWKSSHYNIFKHLDQYEVVIRANCCDRNINSFTGLLEISLPNTAKQFEDMQQLAEMTNLLVLFDGLDEQNDKSASLVRNTMEHLRGCASATVMITARLEGTSQFLRTHLKEGFDVFYWSIIGVPADKKVDFVKKFCEEVKRKNNHLPVAQQLPLCTDNLADLYRMVEQGKLKEYLSVPLHLVFLATVFMFEPDKMKPLPTETRLFYEIHKLCQRRLVDKLRNTGTVDSRSDDAVNNSIKIVLDEIYSIMFEGVKDCHLTLSTKQTNDLYKVCEEQQLNAKMVVSAFLTLQECILSLTETVEVYTAYNKELQEFFAACAIVYQLGRKSIKQSMNTEQSNLEYFTEVLKRVLGLLHIPEMTQHLECKEMRQREVIELLSDAGIKNDKWFEVLEDNEVTSFSLSLIAARMNEEEITLSDARLATFINLKPHLNPTPRKNISIIIKSNNTDQSVLKKLLAEGQNIYAIVRLDLRYHFHHPAADATDDNILEELRNSQPTGLEYFTGHLSASLIGRLPSKTLTELSLVVLHQNQVDALNQASFSALQELEVHVPVKQVTEDIDHWRCGLPRVVHSDGNSGVQLYLSGVDEGNTNIACHIAGMLCPLDPGYGIISFPWSTLCGKAAWTTLITQLANTQIKVQGAVGVPESCVTSQEEDQLSTLTRNTVQGGPHFMRDLGDNFRDWEQ